MCKIKFQDLDNTEKLHTFYYVVQIEYENLYEKLDRK